MTGEETKPAASFVLVDRHTGAQTDHTRLYRPLHHDLLNATLPLYFDVYQFVGEKRLELLVPAGERVPGHLRREFRQIEIERRLYAREDQKEELERYREDTMKDLLADDEVPVAHKCSALQNQTTRLSEILFEKPTALNIRRQRKNVSHMVDFALREPSALRPLLSLTHHDYYTYTHSVNVGLYALTIAIEHLKKNRALYEHNLQEIAAGFFLHDIGKCRVPKNIINKNGPLDPDEWDEMRKHPDHGFKLLDQEQSLGPEIGIIVRQHHEKMNGEGYPDRLQGEAIHLYARICGVADAFDALTTRRSYKPALPSFEALLIMKRDMHAHFDPDIFETFVLLMKRGK